MAGYYWIKLYIEILDDPKMGKLSDQFFRFAIELFLIAGENKREGLLPSVDDISWRLRTSPEKIIEALKALSQIGITQETSDGWLIKNFAKRQASSTSTARVREHRKRSNENGTKRFKLGNVEDVSASASTSFSASESESDSVYESLSNLVPDSEHSGSAGLIGAGEGKVYSMYETNVGALTPTISDALKADRDAFGDEWVCAAIEEAVKSEARNLKYIEAILKRWKKEGFKSPKGRSAEKNEPKGFKGVRDYLISQEVPNVE